MVKKRECGNVEENVEVIWNGLAGTSYTSLNLPPKEGKGLKI